MLKDGVSGPKRAASREAALFGQTTQGVEAFAWRCRNQTDPHSGTIDLTHDLRTR